MEAAPGPPAHLVPIAQARAAHDREAADHGRSRRGGRRGPRARPRPARAARSACACTGPRADGGPLPLVAYLHGGGWAVGSLDSFDPLCRALANASGALIASIDYRLAPEHPFPAAIDDARAAVRWLAASAGGARRRPGAARDRGRLRRRQPRGRHGAAAARRGRTRRCASRRSSTRSATARSTRRRIATNGAGFGLSAESMAALLGALPRRRRRPPPGRLAAAGRRPRRAAAGVRADRARATCCATRARPTRARSRPPACRSTLRRYDGAVHGFFRWLAQGGDRAPRGRRGRRGAARGAGVGDAQGRRADAAGPRRRLGGGRRAAARRRRSCRRRRSARTCT